MKDLRNNNIAFTVELDFFFKLNPATYKNHKGIPVTSISILLNENMYVYLIPSFDEEILSSATITMM